MTDEPSPVLYVETAKRTTEPRDENDAVTGRFGSLGYRLVQSALQAACSRAKWIWLESAQSPLAATVVVLSSGDQRDTEGAWRRLREELAFKGPIFLSGKNDTEDRALPEALEQDAKLFVLTMVRADKCIAEIRDVLATH